MAKTGEGAYAAVDGVEVVAVPTTCVRGRSGLLGKTFCGCLNLQTDVLRVDCAEDPAFWLELDLSAIPAVAAAPGGDVAEEARVEYSGCLEAQRCSARGKESVSSARSGEAEDEVIE